MIPQANWHYSLANLLPKPVWDTLRREIYGKANYICQICGAMDTRMNCHESWMFDDRRHIQYLKGFQCLCDDCHNCFAPKTKLLMPDYSEMAIEDVKVGDYVMGIHGNYKIIAPTKVLGVFRRMAKTVLVNDELICTPNHPFLYLNLWKPISELAEKELPFMGRSPVKDSEFIRGWISGYIFGDGSFWWDPDWETNRRLFRTTSVDEVLIDTLIEYASKFGFELRKSTYPKSTTPFRADLGRNPACLEFESLVRYDSELPNYRRGFLAGMFDAEGSLLRTGRARICEPVISQQVETEAHVRTIHYLNSLGFKYRENHSKATAIGGYKSSALMGNIAINDAVRFFVECHPTLLRKLDYGRAVYSLSLKRRIEKIVPHEVMEVCNLETECGTYAAEGFVVHNCKHWGRTVALVHKEELPSDTIEKLTKHFCEVNNCTVKDFDIHKVEATENWKSRNNHRYRVDFGRFTPERVVKVWRKQQGRK